MHYGYIGIIAALASGIVGLPIPDEVLLTFVGYNVSLGSFTYAGAIASGFAGAFLGITVSYLLGLKLGLPLLHRVGPKIHITEEKIQRTHDLFEKYGPVLLMVGYFIPGVRHLTAYFAGITGLGIRKFCLYAYTGALLWVGVFVTLGWKLGDNYRYVEYYVHQYGTKLFFFAILALAIVAVYMQMTKKAKAQNRV